MLLTSFWIASPPQPAISRCPFPHQRWHKSITVFLGLSYSDLVALEMGLNIRNLSIIYGTIHTYP